ncbi:putative transferase, protein kinase RLK-Pelle-LRR-I-1 family [Helianthus annuus]|nr:putative transferase, protein kinase RLK-Pelle-LRR-I-1 family [Helianthus annuus]
MSAGLLKRREVFTPRKQLFTYSEVVRMTNNFKNEIGRGGFGSVFHGSVGDNQVAVKLLSVLSSQGYKEFQAEVKLLMEIYHTNITSLVGYYDDRNHKAIVYDFMANGNLEKHLFDGRPSVLSWERRLQIGCDAAEELAYLHHGCRPPIVHRDVKSSNILLNEGFQAKLADFGLSRAYPTEDATHVSSSNVAGTFGYLDPEYHSTKRLTEKSDVYSFGVVLPELITSRRAISEGIYITNLVKLAVEEGNVENIIDSRLDGRFDINTAWRVVEIATDCVSPTSIKRPTMNDVVIDLKHCVQAEKNHRIESMSLNFGSMSDPNPR